MEEEEREAGREKKTKPEGEEGRRGYFYARATRSTSKYLHGGFSELHSLPFSISLSLSLSLAITVGPRLVNSSL